MSCYNDNEEEQISVLSWDEDSVCSQMVVAALCREHVKDLFAQPAHPVFTQSRAQWSMSAVSTAKQEHRPLQLPNISPNVYSRKDIRGQTTVTRAPSGSV